MNTHEDMNKLEVELKKDFLIFAQSLKDKYEDRAPAHIILGMINYFIVKFGLEVSSNRYEYLCQCVRMMDIAIADLEDKEKKEDGQ